MTCDKTIHQQLMAPRKKKIIVVHFEATYGSLIFFGGTQYEQISSTKTLGSMS